MSLTRKLAFVAIWALILGAVDSGADDRRISILYSPATFAGGGSGEVYVAASGGGGAEQTGKNEWIVGRFNNSYGSDGNIILSVSPVNLLLDAFSRELSNAGYKTVRADTLPQAVGKGIGFTLTEMKLEENSGLLKDEGSATLSVSISLWKNGRNFKKLQLQSAYSDTAFVSREFLMQNILQKALQNLMKEAIPQIVRELEA
jgi:hypothetical protein